MTGEAAAQDSGQVLPTRCKYLVVGGGAIGAWLLYRLAEEGQDVALVERERELGRRASFGNAGLITVSAAAPIASPGIIGQAFRMMFEPNGPTRLRPRPSRDLIRWIRLFQRHCSPAEVARSTRVAIETVRHSSALLDQLPMSTRDSFHYRRNGLTALYATAEGFEAGRRNAEKLAPYGVSGRAISPGDVWTPLAGIHGAIHFPEDAHLDPFRMVTELAAVSIDRGARVITETTVLGWSTGPRGVAVRTNRGIVECERLIVAAGAWTPKVLGRPHLPMEAGTGYSVDLATPGSSSATPLRLADAKMVVTPFDTFIRATSKLDLRGLTAKPDLARAQRTVPIASSYVPLLTSLPAARPVWSGMRPLSPDGLPYLGQLPSNQAVFVASGHGHLGVSMAPATAEVLMSLLGFGATSMDPNAFRLSRFERGA